MPETDMNDCKICRKSNNLDNMVFCPRCEEWFHYQCAGVNESVADRSWVCVNCSILPPVDPPGQTSTPVSSIAIGPIPSSLSQPASSAPPGLSLPTIVPASADRHSILTEQARASLQWIQEQRDLLEREMEENHRQEMERKRHELKKLANKAMMGIIDTTKDGLANSLGGQLEAAPTGVSKVQNWMQQMVGEMKNLSMAQSAGRPEVTATSLPTFDISSVPTTAGMNLSVFDPTSSSTIHGMPDMSAVAPTTTFPSLQPSSAPLIQSQLSNSVYPSPVPISSAPLAPQLPSGAQSEFSSLGRLATAPRGLVSRVPNLSGLGVNNPTNVVTACSVMPAVGFTQPGISVSPAAQIGNTFSLSTGQSLNYIGSLPNERFPEVQSVAFPASGPGVVLDGRMMSSGQYFQQQPHPGLASNVGAAGGFPNVLNNAPAQPRLYDPVGQHLAPSQHQLMARQVMPKDLPSFRGDPEDWPLFYSAYVNSTTACGYSDFENLARLQKALQGRALEVVKSRLLLPACVPQVVNTLYMLFGRPELIIQTLLNKIREVPPPRADRLDTLISFGMAVQNLCDHLEAAGQLAHLCNPTLLQELVEKLPAQQRLDWALYKRQFVAVDLRTFASYMSTLVAAASEVTVIADTKQLRPAKVGSAKEKNFLNAHSVPEPAKKEVKEESTPTVLCLACNGAGHKVKDCAVFKKWGPDSRWKTVQDHHLCRICLGKHGRRPCKSQAWCGIEGCQQRHHQLLHTQFQKLQQPTEAQPKNPGKGSVEGVNAHRTAEKSTLFRILPVQLSWKGKSVETFAFLDDGSSMTLVEQSIADRLGINDGESLPLCLTWTSDVNRQVPNSQRVSLKISGAGKDEQYALIDTRTVGNLKLPMQSLKYEDLSRQYTHLRGLPIRSYDSVVPGILIGSNNAGLIASLKLREGQLGDPIGAKTRLGWTIYGYAVDRERVANFSFHICECHGEHKTNEQLHDLIKQHFSLENVGVSADQTPESDDDKRAPRLLKETTRRTSVGFETGLLWRTDSVVLPNSYPMAIRRLECFERRLNRDPDLRVSVQRLIEEYLENGYIHEATSHELESADPKKVWYLPLGVVKNPKKPNKIRLVWDAAAKVGGISLNTMLLKGPDMLIPLASVLCGFRQYSVAVSGDLKQMFHQFRIRPQDVHSQRFLYREQPSGPVKTFVMDVGSFGATCSPSQAQYIKNLNAKKHETEFPQAATAIIKKHYVDDYLDSFDTEEEAIKVAMEVKLVHARGGFEIRNWHSNSAALLDRVGEQKLLEPKAINVNTESETERVLGLLWLPNEDLLAFAADLNLNEVTPTKRQILRCVMSLFDSQGILSHITVQGRMIIQDTWRSQVSWDEVVSDASQVRWRKWIKLLDDVNKIRLPRAYFPGFSAADIGVVELHIFTDASEEAYAATAYFRTVIKGEAYCTLIMAKAKVAPLKALSVPRLELMGALLGARLAKAVCEYHTIPIRRRILWTDSLATLAWIQSQHCRYRQFVAFRVGEILSKTEAEEWRWVPTKHNVADEATKWGKGPSTDVESRWFKGPEFLYLPEDKWPVRKLSGPIETTEELRPSLIHHAATTKDIIRWERFSKWERLLRSIAYVHRFLANCRQQQKKRPLFTGCLTKEELQKAEISLWCITQATAYPDEITVLRQQNVNPKKAIEKTSPVYKLSPYLDEQGVMRMDSRIGAASFVGYDFKFPVILPRNHPATLLLINWYHRRYLHANNETVHNEIRQRFHISNLRTVVRHVAKNCQACRIAKVTPSTPKMAPLPDARLAVAVRPFSFVGLDYFGPMQVKVGRSYVKRWIALFTCLTIRAIHLEIVHSLSTESCKMAVRRFVARRGSPVEIYSDNGTNFQGASRELRAEIEATNKEMQETFTNTNTKWIFNPPSAPHFGGSWERLTTLQKKP
ncbi:uncharacterized protein LOC134285126 [Aedes albopictus]|uniref:Uncharacterized protein n=1 Tax=Aedes albopictus TaxID=7160 RepID=A0ABM2A539_AEDAL